MVCSQEHRVTPEYRLFIDRLKSNAHVYTDFSYRIYYSLIRMRQLKRRLTALPPITVLFRNMTISTAHEKLAYHICASISKRPYNSQICYSLTLMQ